VAAISFYGNQVRVLDYVKKGSYKVLDFSCLNPSASTGISALFRGPFRFPPLAYFSYSSLDGYYSPAYTNMEITFYNSFLGLTVFLFFFIQLHRLMDSFFAWIVPVAHSEDESQYKAAIRTATADGIFVIIFNVLMFGVISFLCQ